MSNLGQLADGGRLARHDRGNITRRVQRLDTLRALPCRSLACETRAAGQAQILGVTQSALGRSQIYICPIDTPSSRFKFRSLSESCAVWQYSTVPSG